MHILQSHVARFPDDYSKYSDQHGERFYQVLSSFEGRYKGKSHINMLRDYCCAINFMNK